MIIKVYLKTMKKPIVFELEKQTQYEEFYKQLMTCDIIKFGPIIFKRDDFIYSVIE